jgi:hypothetical protein
VRAGRKLHLNDMAEDAIQACYTVLSNKLIGLALLLQTGSSVLRRVAVNGAANPPTAGTNHAG